MTTQVAQFTILQMVNLSKEVIEKNYLSIKHHVEEAAVKSGRSIEDIQIMAVTKGFPLSFVELSVQAGISLFGENRVLEADQKYSHLLGQVELHLIGHLQRNKAKKAVSLFRCIQSIDKLETAEVLNKYAQSQGKKINILIQVNTSLEETKYGYTDTDKLYREMEILQNFSQLHVTGFMTIAALTKDEKKLRTCFIQLRKLFNNIKERFSLPQCNVLSMGMSNDYIIAVEEGSNLVRIGTALYGTRRGYYG
ncbi:MAG: YggS family pyridoxal phosphate-dependent enzyme [Spirochaetales bacterium]|nr:YggS family pyridoxal phosphate-dependent enzyme [Spirochaetales bacterium]